MQKPTGILLDIDKTITKNDRSISERTIRAIQNVGQSGIKIGLSTGRQFAQLYSSVLPFFPDNSLHIVAGGGNIITKTGQILVAHYLDNDLVKQLLDLANQTGAMLFTGYQDTVYVNSQNYLDNISKHPWTKKAQLFPADLSPFNYGLVVVNPLNPTLETFLNQQVQLGNVIMKPMIDYAGHYYSDITAGGVTKATAVTKWAELQGLDIKDITAVGDSENDLEIIEAVGQGIAMGNAIPRLKEVAKFTIGSNEEDGLAQWLESLL